MRDMRRWYFGKIKRIEAEKILLQPGNESGAFLIRDSESRRNDFSLSSKLFVCHCLENRDWHRLENCSLLSFFENN